MEKSPEAFRTISEVARWLETPTHVLRFWESRFPDVAPVKRAGGRRYYRPEDMQLLGGIKHLLHTEGQTIKAVQARLETDGIQAVVAFSPPLDTAAAPVESPTEPQSAGIADGAIVPDSAPAEMPVALDDADAMAIDTPPEVAPVQEAPAETAPADMLADPADNAEATDEPDQPPIGFFFDDSDDVLDEAPEGKVVPAASPITQNPAFHDRMGRPMPPLDGLPADPDDTAPCSGPILPMSVLLREVVPAALAATRFRGRLSDIHARLSALHDPSE